MKVYVIHWTDEECSAEIGEVYTHKEDAEARIQDLLLAAGKRYLIGEIEERPINPNRKSTIGHCDQCGDIHVCANPLA